MKVISKHDLKHEKKTHDDDTKTTLVILNAPYETYAPVPSVKIYHYDDMTQALNAFSNIPCHWSQLCKKSDAQRIADEALSLFKEHKLEENTYIN